MTRPAPAAGDGRVVLHPADNVEVAVVGEEQVRGHKFALARIPEGEPVVKLGHTIGMASTGIAAGAHVHTHNLAPARPAVTAEQAATELHPPEPAVGRTFDGYVRADGRVGTRNHVLVLTSVNCSASVARVVARRARDEGLDEGLDGISALTHQGGCAIGGDSEGLHNLRRTLAGYAAHANTAGALVIGLGCETNQIEGLMQQHGLVESDRLRTLVIQDAGGSEAAVDAGVAAVGELAETARRDRRQTVSVSALRLALQCGGSDGYSALTANPALGAVSDMLVAHGGTTVLGETPEMHGAEHLLVRRAVNSEVAQQLLDRLAWWRAHSEPEDNPSPGNKRGGLTTIAEKSLGAVAKGGTSPLTAVLRYAEPITGSGFMVMDSPGYDPCSVTGQIASGCNIVCFTTGRGSVSGFAPAPTVKIATNSAMASAMAGDIDLDAGRIATGGATVREVAAELFELLLDVAGGRATASERLGFGEEEFVPWQMGVVT